MKTCRPPLGKAVFIVLVGLVAVSNSSSGHDHGGPLPLSVEDGLPGSSYGDAPSRRALLQSCTSDATCPPGQGCFNGQCGCSFASGTFYCAGDTPAAVQVYGGPGCYATLTNSQACGTSCSVCQPSETCIGGACGCALGTSYCPASGVREAGCYNLFFNPATCGDCGTNCGAGGICTNGVCNCGPNTFFCAATSEAATQIFGPGCYGSQSNPSACGADCRVCAPGLVCVNGACQARDAGNTCTDPAATFCARNYMGVSGCFNLAVSSAACGTCTTRCTPDQVCINGQCGCPPDRPACVSEYFGGLICAFSFFDPRACGASCAICPEGQSCINGSCDCPTGQVYCAAVDTGLPQSACLDLAISANACGACNTRCNVGEQCVNGVCGVA